MRRSSILDVLRKIPWDLETDWKWYRENKSDVKQHFHFGGGLGDKVGIIIKETGNFVDRTTMGRKW